MRVDNSNTDDLVGRAIDGDTMAMRHLMDLHRSQLRRMIAVRMDPRLQSRVDASDVVQETLTEAAARLGDYVRESGGSFYPWLRKLAWQRLVKAHRCHIFTERRSVTREEDPPMEMSDASVLQLANRFAAAHSSPSRLAIREEMKRCVRDALNDMKPHDREILIMIYLEQLSVRETADVIGASEAAVKKRHARALHRLQAALAEESMG